jgi:hypothetical protein
MRQANGGSYAQPNGPLPVQLQLLHRGVPEAAAQALMAKTYRVPVEFVAENDDAARRVIVDIIVALDNAPVRVAGEDLTARTIYWSPVSSTEPTS